MGTVNFRKNDTYRNMYDGFLQIRGHVNAVDDLPVSGISKGDIYTIGDSKSMYIYNEGWSPIGSSDSGSKRSVLDDAYFVDFGYIKNGSELMPYFTQEGLLTYADIVESVMDGVVPENVYFTHTKDSSSYLRSELVFSKPETQDSGVVYEPHYCQNYIQNDVSITLMPTLFFPEPLRLVAELIPAIESMDDHVNVDSEKPVYYFALAFANVANTFVMLIGTIAAGFVILVSPDNNVWVLDIGSDGVVKSIVESDQQVNNGSGVIVEKNRMDKLIGKQVAMPISPDSDSDDSGDPADTR